MFFTFLKKRNILVFDLFSNLLPFMFNYRKNLDVSNDMKQKAVGISFSLDKLSTLFQTESSGIDVILCSLSINSILTKEKLNIAKDLWAMGIKTLVLDVEKV